MAVEIVKALYVAVVAQELHKVVQTDQAVAAHHLADHVVRQVALVAAQRAGVGVRGDEGLRRDLQQIREAGVVEVGHIHQNVFLFHLAHGGLAEFAHAVVRGVARAELVLAVPGQSDGTHALLGERVDAGKVAGEHAAVLNGQERGGLARRPGLLHIVGVAAGGDAVAELLHLAVEICAVLFKAVDGGLPALLIGDEHGVELRPVDILRHIGQRQHAAGVVQRIGIAGVRVFPVFCQRVAVQVDQSIAVHKSSFLSLLGVRGEAPRREELPCCVQIRRSRVRVPLFRSRRPDCHKGRRASAALER